MDEKDLRDRVEALDAALATASRILATVVDELTALRGVINSTRAEYGGER